MSLNPISKGVKTMNKPPPSSDPRNYPPHHLHQIISRLPRPARRKYEQLVAEIDDAQAMVRTSLARERDDDNQISILEQRLERIDRIGDPDQYADVAEELKESIEDLKNRSNERDKRNSVRSNCEQIKSQLDSQFLPTLNTKRLRAVTIVAVLGKGENLTDKILELRGAITAKHSQLQQLKASHLPPNEIEAKLIADIDRLAKGGSPHVNLEGKVDIRWVDQNIYAAPNSPLVVPAGSVSAMFARFQPDRMLEILKESIGFANIKGGIPQAEREPRMEKLAADLIALERQEECFVVMALAAGLEVHRRPYASGFAILGIEVGVVEETNADMEMMAG
jgi:hypothetical protein